MKWLNTTSNVQLFRRYLTSSVMQFQGSYRSQRFNEKFADQDDHKLLQNGNVVESSNQLVQMNAQAPLFIHFSKKFLRTSTRIHYKIPL